MVADGAKRLFGNENVNVKLSKPNPKLLLASLGIAVGIVMVIFALDAATTGDELATLPPAIESIDPVRDATQILSQARIFVDLATGYTGLLILNDVELVPVNIGELETVAIPGKQVTLPIHLMFSIYAGETITKSFQWREHARRPRRRTFENACHIIAKRYDAEEKHQ